MLSVETSSASVVLAGKFNPAIFSPAWFALSGVLTATELDAVTTDVIHPEIARFKTPRFRVEVHQTRFQMTTRIEPFMQVHDDVQHIFSKHLSHTPIGAVGINYQADFMLNSLAQRHKFGRALAPTKPWGDLGKRIDASPVNEEASGVLELVMVEVSPNGRKPGGRRVSIGPSTLDVYKGVSISINDHFEIENYTDESGSAPILKILVSNFDSSIAESKRIVSQMMDFADGV